MQSVYQRTERKSRNKVNGKGRRFLNFEHRHRMPLSQNQIAAYFLSSIAIAGLGQHTEAYAAANWTHPRNNLMENDSAPAAASRDTITSTAATTAHTSSLSLPGPNSDPFSANPIDDPLLIFADRRTEVTAFVGSIRQAVAAHPALAEAQAGQIEAEAGRREARSALFPTIDVGLNARTSFARNFTDDPGIVVERSRSSSRVDATFRIQQRILDFGAASIRTDAAGARIRAANFETERQAERVALEAIAAWTDVFAWRALVQISIAFERRQSDLRDAVLERIDSGVSARGDLARIDSFIASGQVQTANFERRLANAEARFTDLFDTFPPEAIGRVPQAGLRFVSLDAVRSAALSTPVVRIAAAQAQGARQDARAARAETLPNVNAGVEGGRFGLFGSGNDYDVRGTITLEHRFFGGADARADQSEAQALAAQSRADLVSEEAITQATVAWTDLAALEQQLAASERNYIASRQSRDVILERFANIRGTLFDVIEAEEILFEAAASYLQTLVEYDAARYLLLARTGRLLDTLAIDPALLPGTR